MEVTVHATFSEALLPFLEALRVSGDRLGGPLFSSILYSSQDKPIFEQA